MKQLNLVYRDRETGIFGNYHNITSFRYMRHIWETSDGVFAMAVQQGGRDGKHCSLYRSLDKGIHWELVVEISSDSISVCDGIIDSQDSLYFVCSSPLYIFYSRYAKIKRIARKILGFWSDNIRFVKLSYDRKGKSWDLDRSNIVLKNSSRYYVNKASIAKDSEGILWCSYNCINRRNKLCVIQVSYSTDDGLSWRDSGQRFGTVNASQKKFSKIIHFGEKTGILYHDMKSLQKSAKRFAWRADADAVTGAWQESIIKRVSEMSRGDYFTGHEAHWSVASDNAGDIHLSYQDNGINYAQYDSKEQTWLKFKKLQNTGTYSVVSVSPDNTIYVLFHHGGRLLIRKLHKTAQNWSDTHVLAESSFVKDHLRMIAPEFLKSCMPVVFQVDDSNIRLLCTCLDL